MKVAITGGTGFVGRHLAARLSEQGHEVVVIGRDGARAGLLPGRVAFIAADITDTRA
ncbi:MAG TPA: NAD(P)-dependent oxidoreductase [Candidatus Limnocylindrales bacterium]